MEPVEVARAREAYNAYNAGGDPETANKNFRGEPCPEWDDLPQNIRDKWIAAMKPSADTLDGACRWRDDAIAQWRKAYPCPRGCIPVGQCNDPAMMTPAICPVCYNGAQASAVMRINESKPGDVLLDSTGDVWIVSSDRVGVVQMGNNPPEFGHVPFPVWDATERKYGPFTRLVPELSDAK
jgi:hypothetical protein